VARHLLDSDVLISSLRGTLGVLAFVEDLFRDEVPAISALSYFEVWVGVRPKEESAILGFLSSLTILPVDERVAEAAGSYVRSYRKKGMTLGSIDALIAATAKVNELVLVTSNTRDFPMPDIQKRLPTST